MFTISPFIVARRAVLYRERSTGMYSLFAYVTSEALVELPWCFIEVLLGSAIVYPLVGLRSDLDAMAFFVGITFLLVYAHSSLGAVFAHLLPDALAAQLASISLVQVMQIMGGVTVPKQELPKAFAPIYYISLVKYSIEALVSTQFHNDETVICNPQGSVPPVKSIAHRLGVCTSDGSGSLGKVSGVVTTSE